jgi:ribosomal protein S18 acetylase RimI-like enzyme
MFEEKPLAPHCGEVSMILTQKVEKHLSVNVSGLAIRLDPARASDEAFLYRTYASTRTEEMALTGWDTRQCEAFLRMQYEAQRRSYLAQIPDARYWVIRCDEIAVGRLILDHTPAEIHIVDIAVLTEFRKRGIGSALMHAILQEASQGAKSVRLHVERFNSALRWYERMGFRVIDSGPIYLEMVCQPGSEKEDHPAVSQQSVGVEYVNLSD